MICCQTTKYLLSTVTTDLAHRTMVMIISTSLTTLNKQYHHGDWQRSVVDLRLSAILYKQNTIVSSSYPSSVTTAVLTHSIPYSVCRNLWRGTASFGLTTLQTGIYLPLELQLFGGPFADVLAIFLLYTEYVSTYGVTAAVT